MSIDIIVPTLGRKQLFPTLKAITECKGFDDISLKVYVIFNPSALEDFSQFFKKKIGSKRAKKFIFLNCPKASVTAARNKGIKTGKGDVVVFLGDDTKPSPQFLSEVSNFFMIHESENHGFLGNILWDKKFREKNLYQWLESNIQFDFKNLRKGKTPTWHHFYTSNTAIRRSFLEKNNLYFSSKFSGWGFEDTEFGYRFFTAGGKLIFSQNAKVYHDHELSINQIIKNIKTARKNAFIFESLHAEVKILPEHSFFFGVSKTWYYKKILWLANFLPKSIFPQIYWWKVCKKTWIGR